MDAVDDVVVGDDVAAGVDHHAGAHAVDAAAGLGSRRLSGFGGRDDGFFAADVHYRAPHRWTALTIGVSRSSEAAAPARNSRQHPSRPTGAKRGGIDAG